MSSDPERYAQLHEIVVRARLLSGSELEEYLAEACGADDALRGEVCEFLDAGNSDRTGVLFGEGALVGVRAKLEEVLEDEPPGWVPDQIGDYRVLRQIGKGGMGVVYEAEQNSPRRRVAIKLLHPLQATAARLRRFQHEVSLLGQLQHPGIARIYEASTYDAGQGPQPYFAMELVDGIDIRTYCDRHELDRDARLELIARLADVVQYAHDRGIVHRDLKPDNVLVDQGGQPRVLDFGIAYAAADQDQMSTVMTKEGEIIGTLAYMAPEQLSGGGQAVTPQVDLFALGVLGFELLAGRVPRDVGDAPFPRQVAELARAEPVRAGSLDPTLRGDIETILGTALDSDPERRYSSASEFSEDVRRYLANEPIHAHAPSAIYLAGKFVRRNRAVVAGIASTLLVAAVVAAGFSIDASRRERVLKTQKQDVEGLSLARDFDDLTRRVESLWPPHPEQLDAIEDWIEDANSMLEQRQALVARRDELRAMALPRTDAERAAERENHPRFDELVRVQGELQMLLRAIAQTRDGIAVPLPEVDWSLQPSDPMELHVKARNLVHPARTTFGNEALALVLGRRAMELLPLGERWYASLTVTMALFDLGREHEALELSRRIAAEATGEARKGRELAVAALERAVEKVTSPEGRAQRDDRVAELERMEAELEAEVDQRRSWSSFPPEVLAQRRPVWWLSQLDELIARIDSLQSTDGLLSSDGVSEEYGWSVLKRRAFARDLEVGFGPGGAYAARWASAAEELRNTYPGVAVPPQFGLVPLGPDPLSGLWEFWHMQSGSEPERGDDGRWRVQEESGLVLVLMPPDVFRMGAQRDPKNWNDDEHAQLDEEPPHEVQLSAFFLSKYEMTQAQWARARGASPSRWTAETLAEGWAVGPHPVEQVSWRESVDLLAAQGLTLPSEAQWEYASRAGTDAAWPYEREALVRSANLADKSYERQFSGATQFEQWDDGAAAHAPVGSYLPNAFGLHDVIGNVAEWCLDGYDAGFYRRSEPVDPIAPSAGADACVHRGGSCLNVAATARLSARSGAPAAFGAPGVGVRPARELSH